jgi:hypothetical protein
MLLAELQGVKHLYQKTSEDIIDNFLDDIPFNVNS